MKLLLCSAGLGHKSLGQVLVDLVGKPASETKVGFVPTAANGEAGKKDYQINELLQLWRHGFGWIDIVDFSAPGVDWRDRLTAVDVVYVSGGSAIHLLNQARETGFDNWLRENLEHKVYVGSSAGSMLTTPTVEADLRLWGDANAAGLQDFSGLGLVDFEFIPHYCDEVAGEKVEAYAREAKNPVYALDDLSAIRVVDGEVTVLGRGSWKLYGKDS